MQGKRVLLLGAPVAFAEAVEPILARGGMAVDRLGSSSAAVELLTRASFHLVIVGLPAPTGFLNELLRSIRRPGELCRNASVLLVGGRPDAPETAKALASGANGHVGWPQSPELVLETIAASLEVAPRKDIRVMAKIRVALATKMKRIACQSMNLSRSGILLRTEEPLEVGAEAELEFALPGETETIFVRARVVRATEWTRERTHGVGFRFEEYRGEALAKLDRFCGK